MESQELNSSILYRVNDRWYFKLPEHEDLLPYVEDENASEVYVINFNYKETRQVVDKLTSLIILLNKKQVKNIKLENYFDQENMGEKL